MAINEELTFSDEVKKLTTPARILLREIETAEQVYKDFVDDQNGITDLAWGRILFSLVDTKTTTLIIDATAKTVSCRAGANLFANIHVGRNVQMTSFVNAGNNITTEVTSKVSGDTIGISEAPALVDEIDTSARAQENPEQFELDKIDVLQAVAASLHKVYQDFNNIATTQADVAASLRDVV